MWDDAIRKRWIHICSESSLLLVFISFSDIVLFYSTRQNFQNEIRWYFMVLDDKYAMLFHINERPRREYSIAPSDLNQAIF